MTLSTDTLVTIAIVIVGWLFKYLLFDMKKTKELNTYHTTIETRFGTLETKMDLFWSFVRANVPQLLKTYPTDIDKDLLLDKMIHNELTLEDATKLRLILTEEMKTKDKKEAIVYILALGSLEQIIFNLTPRR